LAARIELALRAKLAFHSRPSLEVLRAIVEALRPIKAPAVRVHRALPPSHSTNLAPQMRTTETEIAMDTARLAKAQTLFEGLQGPSMEIIELREQLLDELNHRLKNNLQMLYSVLEIASRKTDNSEAREVLLDTSRRIGAMGTAQQVFYSARDSTDVSGQTFLEAGCANARVFFSGEVSINYEATTGTLPKETAVPLALALNELLTNSVKHGADDRGQVIINVRLSQRSGSHELYVQTADPDSTLRRLKGGHQGSA
jgi:two-component sensor histidine kinase